LGGVSKTPPFLFNSTLFDECPNGLNFNKSCIQLHGGPNDVPI
jgi:hypothetical protein